MAATKISHLQIISRGNLKTSDCLTYLSEEDTESRRESECVWVYNFKFVLVTRFSRHLRIRKPISVWGKHGHMLLATTELMVCIDITVCMDIERNPGPIMEEQTRGISTRQRDKQNAIMYSRKELLTLRKEATKPVSIVIQTLKTFKLFKYRGSRAGQSHGKVKDLLFSTEPTGDVFASGDNVSGKAILVVVVEGLLFNLNVIFRLDR